MNKKLLITLPIAALLLVGCRGGRGGGDDSTTASSGPAASSVSIAPPTGAPTGGSEGTHPASPWPAVPEGNGTSRATPWNITQAWNYVTTTLEETYKTDSSEQDKVKSTEKYYVRGWVCYIQQHSDGRDKSHPHSVQFHMADNNHHVTEEEVMNKSDFTKQGFCVYFADAETPFASQEEAAQIDGKCVTVYGYLLNWGYEPEVTIGGTIYDISDSASV